MCYYIYIYIYIYICYITILISFFGVQEGPEMIQTRSQVFGSDTPRERKIIIDRILRHRGQRPKLKTYVALFQVYGEEVTTQSICIAYDAEGYSSMNTDKVRNQVYRQSIKGIGPDKRWIEIGCGAAALLTRMTLDMRPEHIQAFEINPASAQKASQLLRESSYPHTSWSIFPREFTNKDLPADAQVVLHEIFGFFVSSEGCAQVLQGVGSVNVNAAGPVVLPSMAATLFGPVAAEARHFDRDHALYCSSKIILAKRFPFHECSLSPGFRYFELFDFVQGYDLEQKYAHVFPITRSGVVNGLGVFIYVDGGVPLRRPMSCDVYPFGDNRMPPTLGGKMHRSASFCSNSSSRAYATNWRNPIILLSPVEVRPGFHVNVTSIANFKGTQPQYFFDVTVSDCQNKNISRESVTLKMHDLYPAFQLVRG